jgi:hypothetical protein
MKIKILLVLNLMTLSRKLIRENLFYRLVNLLNAGLKRIPLELREKRLWRNQILPEQEPTLPGPPKKEKKTKKVKEDVKVEEKPFEEPIKLNLSNIPPRKQRPRREKKNE